METHSPQPYDQKKKFHWDLMGISKKFEDDEGP